ncbi:hypothetical protein NMG60_11036846 [Bertholletia excelsa]
MGNKLGLRRQVVDEQYTRPQGLYQHKDVDQKKLRKLILDSKLAPCYPGEEECSHDLEECPICFMCYPSLNRSRCCMKGICTECFLQMKTPSSTRPTRCPYCKTSNYAVEYRGMKTKEEKGMEQIEEQRVIEAKIRMRQRELQHEEQKSLERQETNSSRITIAPERLGYGNLAVPNCMSATEGEEIVSSREPCPPIRQSLHPRQTGDEGSDLDLEDIMVMQAIWLSMQENARHRSPLDVPSEQCMTEDQRVLQAMPSQVESSSSPSGGLACAIAALAECQQMGGESFVIGSSRFYCSGAQVTENNCPARSSDEDPLYMMSRCHGEWGVDRGSEVAEAGTSRASSDWAEDGGTFSALPPQDGMEGSGLQSVGGPVVPESFEEQMMLAMAVSLAEAHARANAPGVAWQ